MKTSKNVSHVQHNNSNNNNSIHGLHVSAYTCLPTTSTISALERTSSKKKKKEKKMKIKRYGETDSRTNTVANYIDTSLLREAAVYHVYIFINVCIIKYIRDKNLLTCYSERVSHSRYEQRREFTRENCIYGGRGSSSQNLRNDGACYCR